MQEVNIDKYVSWVEDGRLFADIRKDLLIRGFSEDQVKFIINELNDHLLSKKINDSKRSLARQWKIAGLILFLVSLLLMIYSAIVHSILFVILSSGGVMSGLALHLNGGKLEKGRSVFQKRIKRNRRF